MAKKGTNRGAREKDPLTGIARRKDIRTRQVGFDLALYDPATTTMHLLNPVAALVWQHSTPGRTVKNLVDAMKLSFGQAAPESDDIAADIKYTIDRFKQEKLLVEEGTKPPKPSPNQPEKFAIPDREVSNLSGYVRPSFKTFTIDELNELFAMNSDTVAPFQDLAQPAAWTETPG